MIRQDDERLNDLWIKDYGCAFFCVLFYVNKYTNLPMGVDEIHDYYTRLILAGCFTEEMWIKWEKAFETLGLPVKYQKREEGADFCIYNWRNPRTNLYHFTAGEKEICTYDSLGKSVTVKEGYIHSKRGFKLL